MKIPDGTLNVKTFTNYYWNMILFYLSTYSSLTRANDFNKYKYNLNCDNLTNKSLQFMKWRMEIKETRMAVSLFL